MSFTLPQASDALRSEARVIREAAERTSEHMLLCMDAVREGHAEIRRLRRPFKFIDDTDWDYIEGLLNAAVRHPQDAQTGIWLKTIKEMRAALTNQQTAPEKS